MANEPEKRSRHDLSSSPLAERQNARFERRSRKRRLLVSEFSKYSTVIRTSHSGVKKRSTVSDCFADFRALLARPKLAKDHRKARLLGFRKGFVFGSAAITLPKRRIRQPGSGLAPGITTTL